MTVFITPAYFGHKIRYNALDEIDRNKFIDSNHPQVLIRGRLQANNRKSRKGKKYRGLKWVRSLQAQCAIYGHIPPTNGKKCYYCGADLE